MRSEFGLADSIEVMEGDARLTLDRVETGTAEVVVGGAFQGASVPWHLTTVEYNEEINRVLRDDGV